MIWGYSKGVALPALLKPMDIHDSWRLHSGAVASCDLWEGFKEGGGGKCDLPFLNIQSSNLDFVDWGRKNMKSENLS